MRRFGWSVAGLALVAVVVVGLLQAGAGDSEEAPSKAYDLAEAKRELADSPAPLAALHEQSAELLDGGRDAFEARLADLKGYPVVVNKWGSWCGPCRAEFPVFQQVATELGTEVAFVGINGQDPQDSAREFLSEYPIPYPSFVDPSFDDKLGDAVKAVGPYPMTAFIKPDGSVEIAIARSYETPAELKADIKKYLGV